MKTCLMLIVLFFSIVSFAKKSTFDFKEKTINLIDANTGKPITDEKVIIYHWYEYPCLTDGIRPSKCVDGSNSELSVSSGRVQINPQRIEKTHLLGKNPKVGIQVSGLCEGQEWHPGSCEIWIPMDEFNKSPNAIEIKIPFKGKKTDSTDPAGSVR